MDLLYICSSCSKAKYREYVEEQGLRTSQQSQKYNTLLMEGLRDCGANVFVISSRPINRLTSKKKWFSGEKEVVDGISYDYVPFLNFPVLRNVFVFLNVFMRIAFSPADKNNTAIVCDALNIASSQSALLAAKLRRFHTVGIVTDVPCHRPTHKIPISQRINLRIMKKFQSYLLLTEQMNKIVNPRKCPYIVMEGHVDSTMKAVVNNIELKHSKKICLYAGTLRRIYGIDNLVNGFVSANIPDTALHIYGDGDYAEEIKRIASKHSAVIFYGVAPNESIVKEELKATLLVNPRPTNDEYTQYSFPSKNMEYMASGTPLLTTVLPGMPKDYYPYVFLLHDESADGIRSALIDILAEPTQALHSKGMMAREFVMKYKNNRIQAQKLLDLIENLQIGKPENSQGQ